VQAVAKSLRGVRDWHFVFRIYNIFGLILGCKVYFPTKMIIMIESKAQQQSSLDETIFLKIV